jgi:hypothetical protein
MAGTTVRETNDYSNNEIDTNAILKIVSLGVSDIIYEIKKKVGTNIPDTNQNVKQILDLFESISAQINGPDGNSGLKQNLMTDDNSVQNANRIILTKDANGIHNTQHLRNIETYYDTNITGLNNLEQVKRERKIDVDLDDNTTIVLNEQNSEELNTNNQSHVNTIQNRLINCQNLELLYLVKHEELMKTFAFTLNLFDKYKYAIKILLYVIKNLVYKKSIPGETEYEREYQPEYPSDRSPNFVKLPKKIIKNMKKLLDDQKAVQETINAMQPTMDDNLIQKINQSDENLITKNLGETGNPVQSTTTP